MVAVDTRADEERIAELSRVSKEKNVAFVEMVYKNNFVRFDIAAMQAQCLTPEQLVTKFFAQAFADIGLPSQSR